MQPLIKSLPVFISLYYYLCNTTYVCPLVATLEPASAAESCAVVLFTACLSVSASSVVA